MNVTIREISFRGSDKNTAVGWLYQPATEKIRGIVQICHGMTEHMGRYHEFMRYLARGGYIVCGADVLPSMAMVFLPMKTGTIYW